MHRWIKRVPEEVMDTLQRYDWPGNIRELENVIERALIHSTGDTLRLLDDPIAHAEAAVVPTDDSTLSAVERLHIEEACCAPAEDGSTVPATLPNAWVCIRTR